MKPHLLTAAVLLCSACTHGEDALPPMPAHTYEIVAEGAARGAAARRTCAAVVEHLQDAQLSADSMSCTLRGREAKCDEAVHHAAWRTTVPYMEGTYSMVLRNAQTMRVLMRWTGGALHLGEAEVE